MAKRQYEKSPRTRLDWFGNQAEINVSTSTTNGGLATGQQILREQPRLALSAGTVDQVAFPAGIVRGDSCSVARFIATASIMDTERRNQNISYDVGIGIVKQEVNNDYISDPIATGAVADAPDALTDLRASWMVHQQTTFDPQAAGANYQHLQLQLRMDTTNSRIFESNEVMQLSFQIRTRQNGVSAAVSTNVRLILLWRCLLRLD